MYIQLINLQLKTIFQNTKSLLTLIYKCKLWNNTDFQQMTFNYFQLLFRLIQAMFSLGLEYFFLPPKLQHPFFPLLRSLRMNNESSSTIWKHWNVLLPTHGWQLQRTKKLNTINKLFIFLLLNCSCSSSIYSSFMEFTLAHSPTHRHTHTHVPYNHSFSPLIMKVTDPSIIFRLVHTNNRYKHNFELNCA